MKGRQKYVWNPNFKWKRRIRFALNHLHGFSQMLHLVKCHDFLSENFFEQFYQFQLAAASWFAFQFKLCSVRHVRTSWTDDNFYECDCVSHLIWKMVWSNSGQMEQLNARISYHWKNKQLFLLLAISKWFIWLLFLGQNRCLRTHIDFQWKFHSTSN